MTYKNFPQPVVKENVDWSMREITNVIKRYGPRESGGENSFSTQKHLKKEMDTFSDETKFSEYKLMPKSQFNFTKIAPIIAILFIVVGIVLFFAIANILVANCVILAGAVIALLLCVLKQPKGKAVTAHNFYAKRRPTGDVKKRIVVAGHCDASYEWRSNKGIIAFGMITLVMSVVVSLLSVLNINEALGNYGIYAHCLTAFVMVLMMFFIDFKAVSPGANTSLTSAYAAVGAIRMLDMAGVDLENTEVVALITDGTEANTSSAEAFANEIKGDGIETAVICVGSLANAENITVSGNSKLKQIAIDSGKNAGIDVKTGNEKLDSAGYEKTGIPAICISAVDTKADYNHNRKDTADKLDKTALQQGFNIILATMFEYDK